MGTCQHSPKPAGGESRGTLSIGLIADIQYADREDGSDWSGAEQRHFRHALQVAKAAVECWNARGVDKVVQLGDIIDGCNAKVGESASALQAVLAVLNRSTAEERIDLIGNHELYNIRRAQLATCGLQCADGKGIFFRSVHLNAHWEAIVLDPFELALIGMPGDHPGFIEAEKLLKIHNPEVIKMAEGGDWFKGLTPKEYRYTPVNGGMSLEQLAWLEQALTAAEGEKRSVLVFSHIPLYEPATKPKTLLWNCDEALAVLHRHKDTVVAVLAGHDHDGGYAVDPEGVHHVTMHSALTAPPGTDCFAILECHDNGSAHFRSHGRACVESRTKGQGRAYTEIVLAKGAQNHPEGAALGGGSPS